jgi:hypothetical protein
MLYIKLISALILDKKYLNPINLYYWHIKRKPYRIKIERKHVITTSLSSLNMTQVK